IGELLARGESYADFLSEDLSNQDVTSLIDLEKRGTVSVVIVSKHRDSILGASANTTEEMRQHIAHDERTFGVKSAVMIHDYTTAPFVCTVTPIVQGSEVTGYVYLFQDADTIRALIAPLVNMLVLSLAVCTVVTLFISWGVSRSISTPLQRISGRIRKIRPTALTGSPGGLGSSNEVKQLYAEVDGMVQRLDQLDDERRTFLRTVAHELRTPLTYLIGYHEVIRNKLVTGRPVSEEIAILEKETERLWVLVERFFQSAVADDARMQLNVSSIQCASWLEQQKSRLEALYGCAIVFEEEEIDSRCVMRIDGVALEQALDNIIQNAFRHGDGNGVWIRMRCSADGLFLTVHNTGSYIPTDERKVIFQKYYRRNSLADGVGLGLSITEEIVEHLGGEVLCDSDEENGTRFTIRIPVQLGTLE
ncbi:MAG: sensor histidine kinase, partial [Bacilli bacterium]